ncbi:MAG: YitT family protein, partial [Firmicutes bacterium]|nr:YitT family protein [Bacillota bacterium]
MREKIWKNRTLWDYALIVLGTFVTAFGITAFYAPNKISDGGVSGIAIILLYTLHIPLWVTTI